MFAADGDGLVSSSSSTSRQTSCSTNPYEHATTETTHNESHQLRSSTQYSHDQKHQPQQPKLQKAFNDVYQLFLGGKPIPHEARRKLEEFEVECDEFYRLVTAREFPKSRYIYLDDWKIKFDLYTQPPHGEVIMEIADQIAVQNRPFKLFYAGTGGDVVLGPGSYRQPDGHWTVNTNCLPNPQQALAAFPINAATGELAPQIVLEVAVSHESMPVTLVQTDLSKYFGPGTGTRAWIGVNVLKSRSSTGPHRWWCGWARRKMVNNAFLDEAELSPESMAIVTTNNIPITQPTNIVFHMDIFTLLHPCDLPQNYPTTLDINLDEVRQIILMLD